MDISLCCAARCSGAPGDRRHETIGAGGARDRPARTRLSRRAPPSARCRCRCRCHCRFRRSPDRSRSAAPRWRATDPVEALLAAGAGAAGAAGPLPSACDDAGGAAAHANDPCSGLVAAAERRPDRMSSRMRIRPRSISSASANAMPANLMTSLSLDRRPTFTTVTVLGSWSVATSDCAETRSMFAWSLAASAADSALLSCLYVCSCCAYCASWAEILLMFAVSMATAALSPASCARVRLTS